ncbi:MAG: zinc metalloprotease HtpX [Thermodesulfobacteriota bacterium]
MGNQIRTVVLLGLLSVLMVMIGGTVGGRQGMIFALALAGVMNFVSYWYSDKIVLSMYRAREVGEADAPQLYSVVRELSQRAGIPMPRVYILPQDAPNAFATGRNPEHAAVAVTQGLLSLMNREELTGVLAHELGHVNNRDILIGSVAATLAGAVTYLAFAARWGALFGGFGGRDDDRGGVLGMLLVAILAPIGAALIQMAISRSREYEADATGARFAGNPQGLARALAKLGAYSKRIPMNAKPATAHMFIVNPLSGGSMNNLFSTHPPLEDRIARLTGHAPSTPERPYSPEGRRDRGADSAKDFWERMS